MNDLNYVKKVFIASPGDIKQERLCINDIIEEVNYAIGDIFKVKFEVVKWETNAIPEMGRPQEIINKQLQIEKCDLFIGIIWSRFGTPTGGKRIDGSFYESGTQEEFEIAYKSWEKTKKPHLLFFRSVKNIPSKNIDAEQFLKVSDFFKEFSYNRGHPGLIKEYRSIKEFERTLRVSLIQHATNVYLESKDKVTLSNNRELPEGLRKIGFKNIYTPDINTLRNADKSASIKNSKNIHLIAHSGYSFVAQFGHRFRDLLEHNLQDGYEFKAILTNPWSESGFFISLGEVASKDMTKFATKPDKDGRIYINPIDTIESANWFKVKFTDSLNGYHILKRRFGDKIQLKFTRYEIPSSILITDGECFIEPYLPVNLTERHEKGMLTFEVKVSCESHLYKHNKSYFDFLWSISDDFDTYLKSIALYKEQLDKKINYILEG